MLSFRCSFSCINILLRTPSFRWYHTLCLALILMMIASDTAHGQHVWSRHDPMLNPCHAQAVFPKSCAAPPNGDTDCFNVAPNTAQCRTRAPSGPAQGHTTLVAGDIHTYGHQDGVGTNAQFYYGARPTLHKETGDIYVRSHQKIKKITPNFEVTTFVGSTNTGWVDGYGTAARFQDPGQTTIYQGDIYVGEYYGCKIRKVNIATALVTTFSGTGVCAHLDGSATTAQFRYIQGLEVHEATGNLYLGDTKRALRKITPNGAVTTIAGIAGVNGCVDGHGTQALFSHVYVTVHQATGDLYIADDLNFVIRKVQPNAVVTTVVGQCGVSGYADGQGTSHALVGRAINAVMHETSGVLYFSDYTNQRIRQMGPDGIVRPFLGNGTRWYAEGTGTNALLHNPGTFSIDSANNIMYLHSPGFDDYGPVLRKIELASGPMIETWT